MRDQLLYFLQNPSRESFLALRSEAMRQDGFHPYDDSLDGVPVMLADGDYAGAVELIRAHLIPGYLLSPGAHWSLGYGLKMLGDEKGEKFEFSLGQQLLNGIQLTGEGTESSPWLISRTSDAHDVLLFLGQKLKEQALVKSEGRTMDRMETVTGGIYYFDVTDMMTALTKRMGGLFEE